MLLVSIPILMTIVEMLNERISFLRAFSQLSVSLSFTTLLGFTGLLAIRWRAAVLTPPASEPRYIKCGDGRKAVSASG